MRLNICFPWADKMFGTLSEEYIQARQANPGYPCQRISGDAWQPLLGGFPMMKKKEDLLA